MALARLSSEPTLVSNGIQLAATRAGTYCRAGKPCAASQSAQAKASRSVCVQGTRNARRMLEPKMARMLALQGAIEYMIPWSILQCASMEEYL